MGRHRICPSVYSFATFFTPETAERFLSMKFGIGGWGSTFNVHRRIEFSFLSVQYNPWLTWRPNITSIEFLRYGPLQKKKKKKGQLFNFLINKHLTNAGLKDKSERFKWIHYLISTARFSIWMLLTPQEQKLSFWNGSTRSSFSMSVCPVRSNISYRLFYFRGARISVSRVCLPLGESDNPFPFAGYLFLCGPSKWMYTLLRL